MEPWHLGFLEAAGPTLNKHRAWCLFPGGRPGARLGWAGSWKLLRRTQGWAVSTSLPSQDLMQRVMASPYSVYTEEGLWF